jgi:hypothetical protein
VGRAINKIPNSGFTEYEKITESRAIASEITITYNPPTFDNRQLYVIAHELRAIVNIVKRKSDKTLFLRLVSIHTYPIIRYRIGHTIENTAILNVNKSTLPLA